MMLSRTFASIFKAFLAGLLFASMPSWAVEDTSYAIEKEYSCLTGGCHETNTQLVNSHANSLMTHAMVKCNACHGTHTTLQQGLPKPNLTGYYPGIGATGYVVGNDRCFACHSAQVLSKTSHPSNPSTCIGCHVPHTFLKK
ncbi:MAG: hypothetical protein Q8J70_02500 [Thiobacillus sp.]|nr:hypothetical protein [Thiobacillus sp.]